MADTFVQNPQDLKNLEIALRPNPQLPPPTNPLEPQMAAPGPIDLPGQQAPNLGISVPPTVKAPVGTLPGNKNEVARLQNTGSGISQIPQKMPNHPVLGHALQTLATVGDTILSNLPGNLGGIGRGIESMIPGTQGHHNLLLGQAQQNVTEGENNEEKEAQTAATNERVPLEAARAEQAATTNPTKEKIAGEHNDTLESIAQENNQTKEDIASKKLTPEAHDAFHEWMANPSQYQAFEKAMTAAKAKPESDAKNGGFMSAFAAVRALQLAYTHNPDLLPVLAPVLTHVFQAQGIPMPANAQEIFSSMPTGQPQNEQGRAIGTGMPGAPTGATRSRGQFAESVLSSIDNAVSQIQQLGDKLGPMSGRFNELYIGEIGAYGPEFSGLQTTLHNIGTAWMRLHADSESARQDFLHALSSAKDAANLIANLQAIDRQAKDYVKQGQGRGGQGSNPPAAPGGGQPEVWVRDKNGKLVKQ